MDPTHTLAAAVTALTGVAILAITGLRGWQGWLALKSRELDLRRAPDAPESEGRSSLGRIELADLRERVRRLEAIASGVDL